MSGVLVLLAVLSALVVPALLIAVLVLLVRSGSTRAQVAPAPRPAALPLRQETVAEVSRLLQQGKKIHAVKALRDATGLGLKESKDRIDRWSGTLELGADAPRAVTDDERLRIEAAAIVTASGWHVAEAFLREQRGLTPEAARALLDSVT